ncbi:hypothetical protein [Sphingobacterium faecale]|uniref:Uncharacterized protein n=1 Tax=Sphingobacterium faecale TaxID=2803775 RepID=A0ABS1R6T8_9SPHI|nr:hypothetical protein [Sphingobacterium faecale]MBL1409571.1 hypothetical protein [Sphingobacterium faecale]
MDLITKIAQENEQKQREKKEYMNTLKKEVNANNFFTDDDAKGFVSKEIFLDEIHSLNKYDLQKIEDFFNKISHKERLYISQFPQAMEGKSFTYYSVKPISKTVVTGYKLPAITGMSQLIDYYTKDYFKFDLKFEELYNNANS